MTKKEAMDLVSIDGSELKNLPVNFRDDKEVVLKAIYNWNDKWFVRDFFDIVSPEIYNDPDIMIAVLQKLNIIDNIEVISKSSTLLNDNEFIQKLIELELVSSKTNLKYKKKIGNYTIVADTPPKLKGYTTPGGESLDKNEIWKDNTFYEQEYFAIYTLTNLYVVDENNKICSSIIEEIEVQNSGYVCTWHSDFWVQGFAILKNEIFFISIGEDVNYYSKKPEFHKLTNDNCGVKYSYQDFIKILPKPIVQDIKINRNYVDWWDGKENLNDFMLLFNI